MLNIKKINVFLGCQQLPNCFEFFLYSLQLERSGCIIYSSDQDFSDQRVDRT